ncbi:MAG TPA: extracellular solute-binding protein, partial [Candidatus Dormibacteraeota bacterium]|nr:extracellular solute-binding protein [Candidatus Dormibacteraeota bacterium]
MNVRAAEAPRRWAWLAVVAAVALALAGCGGGPAKAAIGKQTVTMWMYPVISDQGQNNAFWARLASSFERQHPNITIDISEQTWASRQEAVSAALASGKPPDMILMIPDQIPQYAAQGSLQPLNSLVSGQTSKFMPSTIDGLSYGGKLYAIPLYQDVGTVVYNKKLFAEAGITTMPETWGQMRADAPLLAAKGIPLLDYSGSPAQTLNLTFYQFLWQAGGSVFSHNGKQVVIDSKQGVAALSFLVNLEKEHAMPPDAATNGSQPGLSPFAQGKAAMTFGIDLETAQQLAGYLGRQNVVIGSPLHDTRTVTFGNPGGLVLTKDAAHAAGAKEFLQYLMQPKVEAQISKATGYFAPRKDVPIQSKDPWVKSFSQALPYAYAGDQNIQARKVMAVVADSVQSAL